MTKSIIPQKISAVFLAAVLIAGTFALISPSFMGGAQAEPYGYDNYKKKSYGYDDYKKKSYGYDDYKKKSYGYDNYKKKSYGHDNYKPKYPSYDDKFDKKDVIVKKIKCNQFNLNVNGLSVDIGSSDTGSAPGSTPGVAASNVEDQAVAASAFGNNEGNKNFKKFDKDVVVICISNNDNRGAGGDVDDEEPGPNVQGCLLCFARLPPGQLNAVEDELETNPITIGTTEGIDNILDLCRALSNNPPVAGSTDAVFDLLVAASNPNLPTPLERLLDCLFDAGLLDEEPPETPGPGG